jgi:hypothetical protein
MQKRTKSWLLIGCGAAIFLVMVGVAVVGGLGYVIYQQFGVNSHFVPREDATKALDTVRAQFAGQTPKLTFLENADGKPDVKIAPPPTPSKVQLTSLHVAAFDAKAGKLVNLTIPFWLLRLAPEGGSHVRVDGEEVLNHLSTPSGRLTARDIEALGPGLLVDETRPDGSRFILWTD